MHSHAGCKRACVHASPLSGSYCTTLNSSRASAPTKLLRPARLLSAVVSGQSGLSRVGIVPAGRCATKASCDLHNPCHRLATELVAFLSCHIVCGIGHLIRCSLFVCPRVKSLVLQSPACSGLPFWLCSCTASEYAGSMPRAFVAWQLAVGSLRTACTAGRIATAALCHARVPLQQRCLRVGGALIRVPRRSLATRSLRCPAL